MQSRSKKGKYLRASIGHLLPLKTHHQLPQRASEETDSHLFTNSTRSIHNQANSQTKYK